MFWFYIFLYQWVLPLLLLYAFWPPGRWKVSLESLRLSPYTRYTAPQHPVHNTSVWVQQCRTEHLRFERTFFLLFFLYLSLSLQMPLSPTSHLFILSFFLSLCGTFSLSLSVWHLTYHTLQCPVRFELKARLTCYSTCSHSRHINAHSCTDANELTHT